MFGVCKEYLAPKQYSLQQNRKQERKLKNEMSSLPFESMLFLPYLSPNQMHPKLGHRLDQSLGCVLRSVWAEVDEDGEAGVSVLTHDEASVCLLGSALYHGFILQTVPWSDVVIYGKETHIWHAAKSPGGLVKTVCWAPCSQSI